MKPRPCRDARCAIFCPPASASSRLPPRSARREVRRNGAHDVLGTGTLVHEAWLDISWRPALSFEDRGRFLAYAARTMRGLVIDRVRARHAQKRGGGFVITSLDTESADATA